MNEEQYAFSDTWYQIHPILWKQLNRASLTASEEQTLAEWLVLSEANQQLYEELTNDATLYRELSRLHLAELEKEAIRESVLSSLPGEAVVKKIWPRWINLAAAILILFLVSAGAYYFYFKSNKQEVAQTKPGTGDTLNDLPPGKDVAILQLADGSEIRLDNTQNGVVAEQGHAQVKKQNGELKYEVGSKKSGGSSGEAAYNTVSTPRGGQYQVVLADGSKVFLNAASSIRFPAAFTGHERRVEITGEAYFEVATLQLRSGQKMPFIVMIAQPSGKVAEVEVLGTTFNINSYSNEPQIRTTLLEGSVEVKRGSQLVKIKPGQQASIRRPDLVDGSQKNQASSPIPVKTVDVSQAIAWKDGYFFFGRSDIKTVFRQLERWYDIEVVYEGVVPDDTFSGKIQRNLTLSKVLKYLLQKGNIHYQLDGKKLVIRK